MMKSYAPKTMAELPASLAALTPESEIVGGDTDFVIRLHSGAVQPDALCYLGHIPELKKIEKQGDTISVGAYCTMTQMEHDPIVREYLPALMDAAADVGSLQIRNNGTIGGNLGNASPAGDLIPVMYLYDAKVEIASPNGTRIVPVTDVILRPGKTILEANEAFIRFLFPVPAFKSASVKLGSRKKVTISRIGVALGLDMDGDYVREMKMFAGAVAIKPVAFEKACDFMKGKTINEQNVLDVAGFLSDYIAENVAPEFDRDYKVYASRGVVTDVFDRILGRL